MPLLPRLGLGEPDRRDLGLGEDDGRHHVVVGEVAVARALVERPSALAAMTPPAMRAWYLPMWVSRARPQMSPTA